MRVDLPDRGGTHHGCEVAAQEIDRPPREASTGFLRTSEDGQAYVLEHHKLPVRFRVTG
jgi:hypothetical protein